MWACGMCSSPSPCRGSQGEKKDEGTPRTGGWHPPATGFGPSRASRPEDNGPRDGPLTPRPFRERGGGEGCHPGPLAAALPGPAGRNNGQGLTTDNRELTTDGLQLIAESRRPPSADRELTTDD